MGMWFASHPEFDEVISYSDVTLIIILGTTIS